MKAAASSSAWNGFRRLALKLILYFILLAGICLLAHIAFFDGVRAYQDTAVWITEAKRDAARAGAVRSESGRSLVIVLGDSRLLAAFDPEVFDAATNGKALSYNFALPASTSGVHLELLRELLAAGVKPDRIILGFSAYTPGRIQVKDYRAVGVRSVGEVARMVAEPRGANVLQDWLLPLKRFQKGWMQMLNARLLDPAKDVQLQETRRKFASDLLARRGFFPNRPNPSTLEARKSEPNQLDADVRSDPATTEILNLAEKNQIPVFLVRPPVRPTAQIGSDRLLTEFHEIASEHPGVTLSVTTDVPLVLPVEEFADQVHVTSEGARSFTESIAGELRF